MAGDGDSAGELPGDGLVPPPPVPPPSQAVKKPPNKLSARAKPTTFLFITPLSPIAVRMNEPLLDQDTAFVDFFYIHLITTFDFRA